MAAKTYPVSVRLPKEDADFLAELHVDGATTASDKMRALISDARRRHQGPQDFQSCLSAVEEMLGPVSRRLRHGELRESVHSELLTRLLEWLPDMAAFLIASGEQIEGDGKALRRMEEGVAERAFRLMESLMHLGVTRRCPCYDPEVINQRVAPILELAKVIEARQANERRT